MVSSARARHHPDPTSSVLSTAALLTFLDQRADFNEVLGRPYASQHLPWHHWLSAIKTLLIMVPCTAITLTGVYAAGLDSGGLITLLGCCFIVIGPLMAALLIAAAAQSARQRCIWQRQDELNGQLRAVYELVMAARQQPPPP